MVYRMDIQELQRIKQAGGSTLLASAEYYASLGWAVLPLKPKSKRPLTEHGLNDATTDINVIHDWWLKCPDANIGINCEQSGLVVVDIDPRNGGDSTIKNLLEQYGAFPPTLMQETGGGGEHYFFKHPGNGIKFGSKLGAGVDIKVNGYIVADPSIHPSGGKYTLQGYPTERPPAELPQWIVDLGATTTTTATPLPDSIPEGARNDTFASLAGSMRRRGASVEAILAALEVDNKRCEKPLPQQELARIAKSVGRYEPEAPKTVLPPTVNAVDFMAMDIPHPGSILEGCIDKGAKICVNGPSKARKTFFVMELGISIAAGLPDFLGWSIPQARNVLFVQMEVQDHFSQHRLIDICRAKGVDRASLNKFHIINARGSILEASNIDEIKTRVEQVGAELVIIDPLYKILSDEIDQSAVKKLMAGFDRICNETHAAILYTHHYAKGRGGDKLTIDRASGSGVLARDFDASFNLTPHKEEGLLVLETIVRAYPPHTKVYNQVGGLPVFIF